ncbi:hypothetical protein PtrSN001A_011884, partial [Pyrenophora tritici-repentis]
MPIRLIVAESAIQFAMNTWQVKDLFADRPRSAETNRPHGSQDAQLQPSNLISSGR